MINRLGFQGVLERAYEEIGAYDADILYIYTDFRYFGRYADDFIDREEFCASIVHSFIERDITIILTTFTYTLEGKFDVLSTPTRLGAMNKWILKQPNQRRSEHPLFSFASLGVQSDLVDGIGKSAFGHKSVHERLFGRKAAFLHIGRPICLGNTALHYVEQMCGATYRTNKAFTTEVFKGSQYIGTDYSAFLRRRDIPGETFEFDFSKATEKIYNKKLVKQFGSNENLSNISFYWYDQTIDYLCDIFYKDQRVFIKSDFIGY